MSEAIPPEGMPRVVMYATAWCPYCARARNLLLRKGVQYEEIDVESRAGSRDEMRERAGGRTSVPQIFIGEAHVGGSDNLLALEAAGKLDTLLGRSST